jgi:hypothetical protein
MQHFFQRHDFALDKYRTNCYHPAMKTFDSHPPFPYPSAPDFLLLYPASLTNELNPKQTKTPLTLQNQRFFPSDSLPVFPNEPNPPGLLARIQDKPVHEPLHLV